MADARPARGGRGDVAAGRATAARRRARERPRGRGPAGGRRGPPGRGRPARRRLRGGSFRRRTLVGVSTHDFDAARAAFAGSGLRTTSPSAPIFASGTKTGGAPRGTEELSRVARHQVEAARRDRRNHAGDARRACSMPAPTRAAMIGGLLAAASSSETPVGRSTPRAGASLTGRIYLVGFMGAARRPSAAGLAERLGVPFVDLDAEIERTSGVTVRALFEASGEAAFRERESVFLEGHGVASARGRGDRAAAAFVREENRRTIARLGTPVFLDVPLPRLALPPRRQDRPAAVHRPSSRPRRSPPSGSRSIEWERSASPWQGESVEEAADRALDALSARSRRKALL